MPFLSIVIPCYNVADYLPQTIKSLASLEDAEDVEFIFINDGSTDETLSLIQSFAKSDSRVRIIDQKNQGVSAARNNAIAIATGEYMVCLDGDDYLEPDTIVQLRRACIGADVVMAPVKIVQNGIATRQPWNIANGVYSVEQFFHTVSLFPVTPKLVYRTTIIQQNQIRFDVRLKSGEVFDFSLSVLAFSSKISVISTPFYNYVMRSSSATHAPNCSADLTSLLILEHIGKIDAPWAHESTCLYTTFKTINAFTYNKYLRLRLATPDILDTIDTLLHTPSYLQLLRAIRCCSSVPKLERILIAYQLFMPSRFGYQMMCRINRIFPLLR